MLLPPLNKKHNIFIENYKKLYPQPFYIDSFYGTKFKKSVNLTVELVESFYLNEIDKKKYFIIDDNDELGLNKYSPYNINPDPIDTRKKELLKIKFSKKELITLFNELHSTNKLNNFFKSGFRYGANSFILNLYNSGDEFAIKVLFYLLFNGEIKKNGFELSTNRFYPTKKELLYL